jgi:DNA-binding transcriptional LysR family regulator
MIDWDDVRYFLAVARGGSVRAAAERLGVNHATVLRRIAQLEERLGVHMFEKLPSGYRLTAAGEEVLEFADQMEASSHLLETRVFGRDQSVRGLLRVTLAPPLATHLLMPDFADFARLHPDIEMEILSSGELANLTNRRLRPQNPAAQSSRHEGTGAVRRRLHVLRWTSRVACGRA